MDKVRDLSPERDSKIVWPLHGSCKVQSSRDICTRATKFPFSSLQIVIYGGHFQHISIFINHFREMALPQRHRATVIPLHIKQIRRGEDNTQYFSPGLFHEIRSRNVNFECNSALYILLTSLPQKTWSYLLLDASAQRYRCHAILVGSSQSLCCCCIEITISPCSVHMIFFWPSPESLYKKAWCRSIMLTHLTLSTCDTNKNCQENFRLIYPMVSTSNVNWALLYNCCVVFYIW